MLCTDPANPKTPDFGNRVQKGAITHHQTMKPKPPNGQNEGTRHHTSQFYLPFNRTFSSKCTVFFCRAFSLTELNKNKTGGLGWWSGVGGKAMFFW